MIQLVTRSDGVAVLGLLQLCLQHGHLSTHLLKLEKGGDNEIM